LDRGTLAGQTVVVTSSGRGIGREVAFAFAWLGASVVVAEISDEGLETERLIAEAGRDALFVRTDVSGEAEVCRLRRTTQETFGPVSILVNNAIVWSVASVLDMDVAAWDRVMAVNLRGTFLTCKAFLPDMLARKHGTIVNMVSAEAMPYLSAYIASKQGIAAFSQSLAAEVGDAGVRVIPLAIGMVDTPSIRSVAQELAPHLGLSPGEFLRISLHPALRCCSTD
jgi:NAD(P)-dependent dehydrogenase (short-subunit alcohol dehydrogenase family)